MNRKAFIPMTYTCVFPPPHTYKHIIFSFSSRRRRRRVLVTSYKTLVKRAFKLQQFSLINIKLHRPFPPPPFHLSSFVVEQISSTLISVLAYNVSSFHILFKISTNKLHYSNPHWFRLPRYISFSFKT